MSEIILVLWRLVPCASPPFCFVRRCCCLLLFMLTNASTDRRAFDVPAYRVRVPACRPLYYLKMSAKAVVGRALRETGAALKQASGAEVCLRRVLMMAVARRSGISCMAICRRNGGMSGLDTKSVRCRCADSIHSVLSPLRLIRKASILTHCI